MTVLCGPELQHALERGFVSEIGECHEYRMSPILKGYEEACYAMRCEAEALQAPSVAALAKGLAVSLIGKLHAYEEQWEECQPDYNDPIAGHWIDLDERGRTVEYQAVAGTVARRRRKGLAATAAPAVAAWIWSYGRVWLLDRMLAAGFDEVIYADTDGLVVTECGYERLGAAGLIRDREWGQLRLVVGPVEVEVIGPKCLRIGEEVIQAGAPRAQRGTEFTSDGFWFRRPFQGGGGMYSNGVWEEEYLKRGKPCAGKRIC